MRTKIITFIFLYLQISFVNAQKVIDDLFGGEPREYLISINESQLILYHYKITNTLSIFSGLELYFLKIPLDSVSIKIKGINKNSNTNTIYEKEASNGTIALVSGGFWGYNNLNKEIPIGLVISHGKVLSPPSKWKNGGILYQKSGEIQIAHITKFAQIEIEEAIQSKPILVDNVRITINSNDEIYFDRICIGITNSNELIICGAFNQIGRAISLYEFAEILVNKENSKRPNVKIDLAMDGGPSSHLFFPTLNLNIGYDGNNYIPNMIEITSKK